MIHGSIRNGFGNDAHTEVLIPSNSTDGDTTFVNSAISSGTIVVQNVAHRTATSRFGASSLGIYNTSASGPNCYNSGPSNLNGKDFCLDFWIYWVRNSSLCRTVIYYAEDFPGFSTDNGAWIFIDDKDQLIFNMRRNAGDVFYESFDMAGMDSNGWHHVALCRKGISYYGFWDGVKLFENFSGSVYDFDFTKGNTVPPKWGIQSTMGTDQFFYDEPRLSIGNHRWPIQEQFIPPDRAY